MILAIALAVWISILTSIVLTWTMKRPKGYPPGPWKWPLVGNLPGIYLSESFREYWMHLGLRYNGIASMKIGELDLVVITDYDIAKQANAMEELSDRPPYEFFLFFMKYKNSGILFSNGDNWRTQRRFTLRCLRDFGLGKSVVEDIIVQEFKNLGDIIHPQGLGSKPNVAAVDTALDAAVTNIIWWLAANKKLSKGDTEFQKLLDTVHSLISFDAFQLFSYLPSLFHKMPRGLMGVQKKEDERAFFYSYMQVLINEHRNTIDVNEPRDLVDCYIREQQRLKEAGEDSSVFEDDMIAWTLADLFIAGSETTSITLKWFFLFMIHNPDVQSKIHDEIDKVVGKDRLPSWADKPMMPYTDAAIHEVLRLTPPLPVGLERRAKTDIVLAGYKVPKGTLVTTVIHGVHRNPKYFPDPLCYKPERFLEPDGSFVKDVRIMPFQAGKRQCLGEALARMTLFLGTTYLLQRFTFEKVPGDQYSFRPQRKIECMTVPEQFRVVVKPRS